MATDDFDTEQFEKRLHGLKDSQESIQGLSSWCLERRPHHKKIVATWLQVLKKVKVDHRLTLFYLANDVIQYSKRKNYEFVESWGTALQRATTMVRDEKVKHRILRIFKIWDQRQVYDEEFLADLSGLLSAAPPKKKVEPQPIAVPEEFQAALLIASMRSCATLEQATDARLRDLRECKVDIDNADELCASLKDRRHVEDAESDIDVAVRNVENYVQALEVELRDRHQLLELLEQADQFYETQRGEVKIVSNAYRNFGGRVKNLKKKLDELIPMLASPIPSPDVNAPSPSPDSDIELPDEDMAVTNLSQSMIAPPTMYGSYGQDYDLTATTEAIHAANDFSPNFSSFMGGNMDFDMRSLFNDKSDTSQQYEPTEDNESTESYNTQSFLKSIPTPLDNVSMARIPALGDVTDANSSPQRHNYGHIPGTSLSSRMLQTPGKAPNSHSMQHSTPLRNVESSPYSSQNSQSNFENSVVNPLPPPPLPPQMFLDEENCYNKLPPKFPTWAPTNDAPNERPKWNEKGKNVNPMWTSESEKEKNQWSEVEWSQGTNASWSANNTRKDLETPESPPMYEKSSFREPVEYNDTHQQDPLLGNAGDVDHRVIPLPLPLNSPMPHRLVKAADVDHRNLISLTGSPANNNTSENSMPPNSNETMWSNSDRDYRQQPQAGDNVESVDMDMSLSDEENENKQKNRVLVDIRSQDRDMRGPPNPSDSQPRLDMDMRLLANSGSLLPPPPPPPLSQFPANQSKFPQGSPFGHNNPMEFQPPNPPPGFQQDFMPRPDFNQSQGPNFHSDFNYHENNQVHEGRFLPQGDHREPFNRGRGRGFPRRGSNQWNNGNRQDSRQRTPEKPMQDNFVLLDDEGMPINLPEEFEEDVSRLEMPLDDPEVDLQGMSEPPKQLSEQLEALMNTSEKELEDEDNASSNGPQMHLNGPPEIHPVTVFDYGNASPNFRPRGPFPGWRGRGFRGGPRPMWSPDARPRGPPPSQNFTPRGMNRGAAQFRGFRGRGRGNW